MKRAKIVATIGPASATLNYLKRMIRAGMNVARLNFSHGDYPSHQKLIDNIRQAAKESNQCVAIQVDLQGPRMRIGDTGINGLEVAEGKEIILKPQQRVSTKAGKKIVPVQFRGLAKTVKKNCHILIDDGFIELRVLKVVKDQVICQVLTTGIIFPHKGINTPGASLGPQALTIKDKKDVAFIIKAGVDFIALSFVRQEKDINQLQKIIKQQESKKHYPRGEVNIYRRQEEKTHTKIIAKIERLEAYQRIDEIIAAADGVMVARGDLALEAPAEKVPMMQKEIIKKCNAASKPVIVATQMLNSMITNPVPTRAEVSDVANAIIDGTDAVMLSAESASGKYPIKSVQEMNRIILQAENYFYKTELTDLRKRQEVDIDKQEAVGYAVAKVAEDLGAKAIIAATSSGITARAIASYRPRIPIYAFSPFKKPQRQLALSWGLEPCPIKLVSSFETLIKNALKYLLARKKVKKGEKVVITVGYPFRTVGQDNFIRVHQV